MKPSNILIQNARSLSAWLEGLQGLSSEKNDPAFLPPKRVLMVTPEHYRIEYAINPYMRDPVTGELNQVDSNRATRQWHALYSTYESLGFPVKTIPASAELPDMVYAANQSFPFQMRSDSRPRVIMSRMASKARAAEVDFFRSWYRTQGYEIMELESGRTRSNAYFEGCGDALMHPRLPLILGGFGHRTSLEVYEEIAARSGASVLSLKLLREDFYHLDTCLSILDEKTAVYQPAAFDEIGRQALQKLFPRLLPLDMDENLKFFTGNCHCPDQKNVIVQKGAAGLARQIEPLGFDARFVDTSEFIKGGGSVFCLKMMIY